MIQKILRWLGWKHAEIESWDALQKSIKQDINAPATLCVISVNEHGKRFVSRIQTTAIIGDDGITVAVTVGQIVEDFLQRAGGQEDG